MKKLVRAGLKAACCAYLLLSVTAQAREADDEMMALAQSLADQAGLQCMVTDARDFATHITRGRGGNRYTPSNAGARPSVIEVSCRDGLGFVILPPVKVRDSGNDPGQPPLLQAISCLETANPANTRNLRCELDSNANQLAGLTALARRAEIPCPVTGGRSIGQSPTASFIEISCGDGAAFLAQQTDIDHFGALTSCQDPSVAGVCQKP